MKLDEETLRTSWTLVARLKNVDDHEHWQKFYQLYHGLIVGVAMKAGLREDEAQEVLQETMTSVSKNIQEFEADPARGSFRAWLLKTARWRIQDQFRKRLPVAVNNGASSDGTATRPLCGACAATVRGGAGALRRHAKRVPPNLTRCKE